jgi:murein endopeptidase/LysM repeat protein
MAQNKSAFWLTFVCTFLTALSLLAPILSTNSAHALTASIGQPYRGYLINGVPFPAQFRGYYVRDDGKSYGTPELIGAVLDAIEKVQAKYSNSADLFIGDISGPQGGRMRHHRSHTNGRDIDLGMYTKDNSQLKGFACMTEDNLDVSKTWELVDNLLRSRRVQYIFVDNSIQRLLYQHALSQGTDRTFLDHIFGVAGNQNPRTPIQHMRGHRDHLHVRFYAPWSMLAGQLASLTEKQRDLIELAQGAYVPKKVNYYVQGSESGLPALAASFGVTTRDLCRWNQLHGNEILTPGACLTFYKRGFEVEPVRLAQSLQPNTGVELPVAMAGERRAAAPVKLASLQEELGDVVTDAEDQPVRVLPTDQRVSAKPQMSTYSARKGETLASVAKKNKIDVDTLCRLNGLKKNAKLGSGQKLKVPDKDSNYASERDRAVPSKSTSTTKSVAKVDSKKTHGKAAGKHDKVVASGKGKATHTASNKNTKIEKKTTGKQTASSVASRHSRQDTRTDHKTVAGKQSDGAKGRTSTASSKTTTATSKQSAHQTKKEVGKPAATKSSAAPQKKASSTSVAANNPAKSKKRM